VLEALERAGDIADEGDDLLVGVLIVEVEATAPVAAEGGGDGVAGVAGVAAADEMAIPVEAMGLVSDKVGWPAVGGDR
jgi:hypothetical protein